MRCSSRGGERSLGGTLQKTEVTVFTRSGVVRAEEQDANLYSTIDRVSDKIERKLRKLKEKNLSNKKHNKHASAKETTLKVMEAEADVDEEEFAYADGELAFEVSLIPSM